MFGIAYKSHVSRSNVQPEEPQSDSQLTHNKEAGAWVLWLQGDKFCQNSSETESKLFLNQASRRECSLANTLISAFRDPEQRTQLTHSSDSQKL